MFKTIKKRKQKKITGHFPHAMTLPLTLGRNHFAPTTPKDNHPITNMPHAIKIGKPTASAIFGITQGYGFTNTAQLWHPMPPVGRY